MLEKLNNQSTPVKLIIALVVGAVIVAAAIYTPLEGIAIGSIWDKTKADKATLATKEAENFEKRVKVIDQLHNDQTGPVTLLNTVGNTVNVTDAVWLSNMTDSGNNINIEGQALSTTAVANLMTNLKRTGYFKNVEIKDATQDAGIKDMTQFNFSLICEKQPKS